MSAYWSQEGGSSLLMVAAGRALMTLTGCVTNLVVVVVFVVVLVIVLLIVVLVILLVLVILVGLAREPAHCVGDQLAPEGRPA